MSTEYRFKSVWGEVMTTEEKVLSSGKFIVTVRVKEDSGAIWVCTLWDDLALKFRESDMKGQRVYVEGGRREENCISVKFYDVHRHATPQAPKREPEIRREYEPVVTVMEHDRERVKVVYIEPNGLRTYQLKPKSHFAKVNGAWESLLEYCIRNMGGAEVTTWLREYGSFLPIEVVGQGQVKSVADHKSFAPKLLSMVTACAKHHGDYVELADGTILGEGV